MHDMSTVPEGVPPPKKQRGKKSAKMAPEAAEAPEDVWADCLRSFDVAEGDADAGGDAAPASNDPYTLFFFGARNAAASFPSAKKGHTGLVSATRH